jgi:Tol biopolymer transport system component
LRDVPYAARINPGPESLLVDEPTVSETRIAFTKLQPPAYSIGSISGNRMSSFGVRSDLFHPAVLPHSSQALVELPAAKSRIVRIDLDEEPPSEEGLPVEVEDGESPSVSPDGRWLLFIREVRGRGSLWIKSLQEQPTESSAAESKLVGAEYDVLEASFDPDGTEIVFAAQPRGRPALFTLERSSSRISQSSPGSASRYPAISPDGRWLTYARLHGRNWQIWLKSRDSVASEERQLTQGDCNSISPAWTADSRELIYATDCGRGVGMTALARIRALP